MNVYLRCFVSLATLSFAVVWSALSQGRLSPPGVFVKPPDLSFSSAQRQSGEPARFRIPGKKVSQYTAEDWGAWIDTTWGAGQPVDVQLQVFDSWWDLNDQQSGVFANHLIDWDSVKNVYRPQIGSGLSRGKFYALMSRMWLALMELHTYVYDPAVDNTYMPGGTFQYRSGFPLICIGPWWWDVLGAPVTLLPDSTCAVYRVAPGNPLGLEPGDLVLGFEGILWKNLFPSLLEFGVPVSVQGSQTGSTPEAMTYASLAAVGWSWGMFDTIDVVKYSTGDTLHLPTAVLESVSETVFASDQVPIAGVPMPEAPSGDHAVSWGVISGTNIGYIYAWDWEGTATSNLFRAAVTDLCQTKGVEGLVLDLRMNFGSSRTPTTANAGLSMLFNIDPTPNICVHQRTDPVDHMGFSFYRNYPGFAPSAYPFDHPIAVLLGPGCYSAGDYNAFRMRFHPMARSFGKPTNGAFVSDPQNGVLSGGWRYNYPPNIGYSNIPGEGYLVHKGVRPDEEVWLTRDGVAKGEDDVVKRALEWITTLTYAHDVAADRTYARPLLDSVRFTARLTNPLGHVVAMSAVVTDGSGAVRDSIRMYDDGLHGDGQAADTMWGCYVPGYPDEGFFGVSMRTDDITQGTHRRLTDIARFTTAGPLTLDKVAYTKIPTTMLDIQPYVRNNGHVATIQGASILLRSRDPWVTKPDMPARAIPVIAPDTVVASTGTVHLYYDPATFPGYVNLVAEISVSGKTYWTDSTTLIVTGVEEQKGVPTMFALEQNYPNPFNPGTTIKFELPKSSMVRLSVYDMLGREVAVLVNERRDVGVHEVKFDGANPASGVYFYRLQAGDIVQSKRMLILK